MPYNPVIIQFGS